MSSRPSTRGDAAERRGKTDREIAAAQLFVVLACQRPAGSHPAESCLAKDDFCRREQLADRHSADRNPRTNRGRDGD
jgi:hypothetical protein